MEPQKLTREEIALQLLVGLITSSQRSIDDLCPIDVSPASNPDRLVKTQWMVENAFRLADVFIKVRDLA